MLISPSIFDSKLNCRPFIKFIRQTLGKELVGVEIGVRLGANSKNILETLSIKTLYLVDPYDIYYLCTGELIDERRSFRIAEENLSQFKEKIVFVKKKSCDAVKDIPDNLDFVYIDGDHRYEFVKSDIELYYPKIALGGVLGGHDYSVEFLDVTRAVLEFVDAHKLKLYGKKKDWWVVKGIKK